MTRTTETVNPVSKGIDTKPLGEVLRIINSEDALTAGAVSAQLPAIERAVEKVIDTIGRGGRVFMVGAGTSGRLCVLEAAEVPPTFGVSPGLFQGVVAGGVPALSGSVEAAEDDSEAALVELRRRGLRSLDLVLGVASSGGTPYTLGAVRYAREVGASTVGLSCNLDSELSQLVDAPIEVVVGSEAVAGSTRMKAGTAQKMVLNMITTTAMIRLGRVHDGYMVGVQASNTKLADRSRRTLSSLTGLSPLEAEKALKLAGGDLRVAIIMTLSGAGVDEAREALEGWVSVREVLRRLDA
jgi:N-acetylmuramic acid 6-phosphate etherase